MRTLLRQVKASKREFGMTITGALCTMFALLMFLLNILLAFAGQLVATPLCLFLLFLTMALVSAVRQARRFERGTIGLRAPSPPTPPLAGPSLSCQVALLGSEAPS